MNDTPTPRTERAISKLVDLDGASIIEYVHAPFARQLERELAATIAVKDSLHDAVLDRDEKLAAVTAERDAIQMVSEARLVLAHDSIKDADNLRAENAELKALTEIPKGAVGGDLCRGCVYYRAYDAVAHERDALRVDLAAWKDAAMERKEVLERFRAENAKLKTVLDLISSPLRPDGTWNRDREACRSLAKEALGE